MDAETLKHRNTVKAMKRRGMSQRDIAASIGISLATVNRLLKLDDEQEGESAVQQLQRRMHEHDAEFEARRKRGEIPPPDVIATLEW